MNQQQKIEEARAFVNGSHLGKSAARELDRAIILMRNLLAALDEPRPVSDLPGYADIMLDPEIGERAMAIVAVHRSPRPEPTAEALAVTPTEPGIYLDSWGNTWRLHGDRAFMMSGFPRQDPTGYAPFVRLVPERTPTDDSPRVPCGDATGLAAADATRDPGCPCWPVGAGRGERREPCLSAHHSETPSGHWQESRRTRSTGRPARLAPRRTEMTEKLTDVVLVWGTPGDIELESDGGGEYASTYRLTPRGAAKIAQALGATMFRDAEFCGHEFPEEGDAVHVPGEPVEMICLASPMVTDRTIRHEEEA